MVTGPGSPAGRQDPHPLDSPGGHFLPQVYLGQRRVELRHCHVGGDDVRRAALLGAVKPRGSPLSQPRPALGLNRNSSLIPKPQGQGREEFRGPAFIWYRPSMGLFSQCLLKAYCVPGLVRGSRPSL